MPYALAGLLLAVAVIIAVLAGGVGWLVAAVAPLAVLGTGAQRLIQVLGAGPVGSVARLTEPVARVRSFAAGELDRAYDDLIDSPDYRRRTGFLYLVNVDLNRVLDLVATVRRPLVVFIDDLDRCSPSTVVQVIEAINLFVAGPFPNTIFVVAMEPEMVAAHIEAVYGDLVKQLKDTEGTAAQAFDLGWRFLEKIVQLPLTLPPMEPQIRTTFLNSLFAVAQAPQQAQPATTPQASEVEVRAAEQQISSSSLSDAVSLADAAPADDAVREAVRRVVERKLTADDPEVQAVITYASGFLSPNPREIKRFVNLFRFYTIISTERRLNGLPTPATLLELAKLAVLGIRWPGLLGPLGLPLEDGGDRTIFELLEERPDDPVLEQSLAAAGVGVADQRRLSGRTLRRFLASEPMLGERVRGFL